MTKTLKQQTITQSYDQYIGAIEGILFAAGDAVEIGDIASALSLSVGVVDQIADMMASAYEDVSRGIRLIRVGGSLQLSTKPMLYPYISQILSLRQSGSLSRAALETLSIIAYRQPITRVEVEQIRGVSSASSIKNLLDREMIVEAGRKDAPGRPFFYKTTEAFLKAAHVEKLSDLPDFEAFMSASIEERVEDAMPGEDSQIDGEDTTGESIDQSNTGQGMSGEESQINDEDASSEALVASDAGQEMPGEKSQSNDGKMISETSVQFSVEKAAPEADSQTRFKEESPGAEEQTAANEAVPSADHQKDSEEAISEQVVQTAEEIIAEAVSESDEKEKAFNVVETTVKGLKAFEMLSESETDISEREDSGESAVSDDGSREKTMADGEES